MVICTTLTVTGGGGGGVLGSISIPPNASVNVGSSTNISATCKDTNGNTINCPTLVWGSGNTGVVTVNNGVITGISAGTIPINCWDSVTGITSNSCQVTVTGGGGVGILGSISISPSNVTVNVGSNISISVTCKDTNGTGMTCPVLTWTSSNTSVATVYNGTITGVGIGTSMVTATGGGKTSNSCTVSTVSPGCTNPKYKCVGNVCTSDNCDGSGTMSAGCAGSTCAGGVVNNYGCSGNQCLQGYGSMPAGCYNSCGGAGVQCLPDQMNIFGSCYKRNDVLMGVGAVVLLMVLTKK